MSMSGPRGGAPPSGYGGRNGGKIDLNQHRPQRDELELLNAADIPIPSKFAFPDVPPGENGSRTLTSSAACSRLSCRRHQLTDLARRDTGHPVKHEMDSLHVIPATIWQRVRQPPFGDPGAKRH
jgi:hypothetical protein